MNPAPGLPVTMRTTSGLSAHREGRVVFGACGVIGWIIGIYFADWQWAIEHAQWLAGVAAPIEGSLSAALHTRLWSALPQLAALPLSLGATEWAVTLVLSGLAGMLTCQALGMFAFALSQHAVASVASIAVVPLLNDVAGGAAYPVGLMGSPHSYGAFGIAVSVLALALMGARWSRSGAFLLAIVPAVHLPLGAATWVIVALARPEAFRWRAFLIGAAVTATSALVHLGLTPSLGPVDPVNASPVVQAFTQLWDGHRAPIDPRGGAFLLTVATAVVALLLRPQTFAGRAVAVAGVVGALGAALTWMPANALPSLVITMMPGRVMNIALLMWPAVCFGLVSRWLPAMRLPESRPLWVGGVLVGLLLTVVAATWTRLESPRASSVWSSVTRHEGPIVTAGGVSQVQARTRRVVLIDGGTLDALAYVPEAAVWTRDVLLDVYGIDILAPPDRALARGVIPLSAHRHVWERRTREEWVALRHRYGITGVLGDATWTLALPQVSEDGHLRFYRIPEG